MLGDVLLEGSEIGGGVAALLGALIDVVHAEGRRLVGRRRRRSFLGAGGSRRCGGPFGGVGLLPSGPVGRCDHDDRGRVAAQVGALRGAGGQLDEVLTRYAPNVCSLANPLGEGWAMRTYVN